MAVPRGQTTFNDAESQALMKGLAAGSAELLCPRCGKTLDSDLPRGGRCSMPEVWELHCSLCRVSLLVPDYPTM